jgi:hypothetical protein
MLNRQGLRLALAKRCVRLVAKVRQLSKTLFNLLKLQRRQKGEVMKTPAWQRSEGKNPKGGLNEKGRASYNATTGGDLKPPVKSGDNPRRASFLARMGNANGPEYKNGEPTRLLLSLKAWGASSKADAKAKAKAISARNKGKK